MKIQDFIFYTFASLSLPPAFILLLKYIKDMYEFIGKKFGITDPAFAIFCCIGVLMIVCVVGIVHSQEDLPTNPQ